MTLFELRDELAPQLRAALRRDRSLVARMVPWGLVLRIALWVLQLLAARISTGRPTVTPLLTCSPVDFDPEIKAALAGPVE